MTISKNDKVKEFTLKNQNDEEVSLSDYEGKKVLLSFHPLAWTSVCTKQMKALEKNYEVFKENNTIPLGLSVDPQPSKKAWAEDMGLEKLDILSDFWPHGEFSKELDIFIEKLGFSGRVNILLDESRNVIWAKEYEIGQLPDIDEVLNKVKNN
ncbi:MAG TPA: redoxin domain-containing protein [Halanaerobiales bacterium]|nr:redoxin domain-containing protein [Halanaerobiales bacterium]